MTKQTRNTKRVPLDLSQEQHSALTAFFKANPDIRQAQWLRQVIGEAYTAETEQPWPDDPIWGDQGNKK